MISATAGPRIWTTRAGSNDPPATGAGLTTGIVTTGVGLGDGEVLLVPIGCVVHVATSRAPANRAAKRTRMSLPICVPVIRAVEPTRIAPVRAGERLHRIDVVE